MSTQAVPRLTVEEYLARERASEIRHEFYAGEIFEITGASVRHGEIVTNMVVSLHQGLAPKGCKVISSSLRVCTGPGALYTYPDVVLYCGKGRFIESEADTLLNPLVLFEVLSPSSKDCDRGSKFELYRGIPSLRDYVVIAQERPHVEHHALQPGGRWILTEAGKLDEAVHLTAVEFALPLSAIYQGVSFDATA